MILHDKQIFQFKQLYKIIKTKNFFSVIQSIIKQSWAFIKIMKNQTVIKTNNKSLSKQSKSIKSQKKNQQPQTPPTNSTTINTITKQNYDIMYKKYNITQVQPLQMKYVLKCIEGLYKNRFLYITTHKEGQIIGSGNVKEQGLTLQIEGVGLAPKHVKLKFNGLNKFYVKDYNTETGTWMKVSRQGVQIKHNDNYIVGKFNLIFHLTHPINQIQQLCILYKVNQLADLLIYNRIMTLSQLYKASYEKYKNYPFTDDQIKILQKICQQSKNWYNQDKQYKNINMYYLNEQLIGFSQEIGWQTKRIYNTIQQNIKAYNEDADNYIAQIVKGRLMPKARIFSKIQGDKNYQLNLHDQIKIGNLQFQLNRFNVGVGESKGGRQLMQDCLIYEQDIGGSEWKIVSIFAVIDGYGGTECMQYIKDNLVNKIRQWVPKLDQTGDLNQAIKLLMAKTFYELDYQFYQKHTDIADSCGATILCLFIIDSKAYVINIGDNKGYLYRDQLLYKLSIDHIPNRIDQKARIQEAGSFVQHGRLNGKCTLSRVIGQFQYKNVEDYTNNMKGKLKSYLSCVPDIVCFDINPATDDFIILSTDGIFQILNPKTVVDYVLQRSMRLQSQENPDKINCKITNNQCDNMAAILIFIKKGKIGSKNAF